MKENHKRPNSFSTPQMLAAWSFRAACLLGCSLSIYAAPVQWRVEDGGNGHYYEMVGNYLDHGDRYTWFESKAMAEGMTHLGAQGHLVTIGSAGENAFLISTFHNANPWPTWIGFTDSETYGGNESFGQANPQTTGWVWVTGEAITFTGWVHGAPENTGNEDFALMGSQWGDHHDWNDSHGTDHAQFFVEFEPVAAPDSSPLDLALALVFLSLLPGLGMRGGLRSNL